MFGGAFENLLILLSFYGASMEEIMLKARPGPPWGAGGSRHCGQRNRLGVSPGGNPQAMALGRDSGFSEYFAIGWISVNY